MIPEWLVLGLAMLGCCALALGKPKWALLLCGPALWNYIISPLVWEGLRSLPLWIAVPVGAVIGFRLIFGMLAQGLAVLVGDHVAEDALGHVVGHFLQKAIGGLFKCLAAIATWPIRSILLLLK